MGSRPRTCCHTLLASILKFLNFLQFFIGLCMIIYSAYMLNHWHHHRSSLHSPGTSISADQIVSNLVNGVQLEFQSLPAPWFIYGFMGVGILLCCITCAGHIAAEAINGCCLCFYVVLATMFVLLEASLVAFIAIDRSWEKDLPLEPTGELDSLRVFVEENMDVCKWVGIGVISLQALSLLLAIILRALISCERVDVSNDEEHGFRGGPSELLLNAQLGHSFKGDSKVTHSDIWSSRMREKYLLNNDETKNNFSNVTSSIDSTSSGTG